MVDYIMYVTIFIVIYLIYLVFVLLRKKQLENFKKSSYVILLEKRYNIDLKKINFKVLAHMVCIGNSFILATTVFVMSQFENTILMLLIGIVTMIILTVGIYHLIGSFYGKREK